MVTCAGQGWLGPHPAPHGLVPGSSPWQVTQAPPQDLPPAFPTSVLVDDQLTAGRRGGGKWAQPLHCPRGRPQQRMRPREEAGQPKAWEPALQTKSRLRLP